MNTKRPLMDAAGGFVLGEVCALLPMEFCVGILALVGARVSYRWKKRRGRNLFWWILPLFVILGMGRMDRDQEQIRISKETYAQVEGERIWVEGRICAIKEGERSTVLELEEVVFKSDQGKKEYPPVVVYVKSGEGGNQELRIGRRIGVWGELERFSASGNPGQFDYEKYYHALGMEGRVFGEEIQVIDWGFSPYLDGIYTRRQIWKKRLETLCDLEDLGVFQAVVLGEKSGLSEEMRTLYQRNGIAHLLAVSGLHISMIGLGFYHLLRKWGIGFGVSGAASFGLTVSYGVLTGGSASVVRAVVMIGFQLGADQMGRTYDLLSAMAGAALLLLFQSPSFLFQAGFQLSFGAVFAIGAVLPELVRWLEVKRGWEKNLLVAFAVQIVTFPVIGYHFFEYPVYGMALNLLVIPLRGYVVTSGLLGILLGGIWPFGGEIAIGTGHFILVLYQRLCLGFEKIPGALWIVGRPKIWQIGIYGGMWGVCFMMATKMQERRGAVQRWKKAGVLALLIVAGSLILKPLPQSGLSAVFLDVGQGDGICLRTREATVLVDGGSSDEKKLGEQILEPFLKSKGISKVDYAIVSHGDQDHISGLTDLLEQNRGIYVEHLVLPWLGQGEDGYEDLVKLAKDSGTEIHWMRAGDRILTGRLEIRCLYAGREVYRQDRNEHSLFLEVSYGNVGILLTGDMSKEGERDWLADLGEFGVEERRVRILKAAHHGSKHSSTREFLQAVSPNLVVISCGEKNRYGHPNEEMLGRLEEEGIEYLVTMEEGAVIMETDGERAWRYWGYREK